MSNRIWDWAAKTCKTIFSAAGVITLGLKMEREPRGTVPSLPNICPHDFAFRPIPDLSKPDASCPPFTCTGFDVVSSHPASKLHSCLNFKYY